MKGYIMSDAELRALQLVELELLLEVDRICRKCGIDYRAIAGTLLGAVRHGGFIPWDDDADIELLREDYERFREACETELDTEKFYFQDHIKTPGYRWGYGKLRRKDTQFVRLGQEHMPYEQGIFIDLFPLDCVPENILLRQVHCFRCFLYRKAFWSEVGAKTAKGFERAAYLLLRKIPPGPLYRSYDRFAKKCNRHKSKWVRTLTFPTPTRDYGFLRKWSQKSADYLFEGVCLRGIAEYDEYLTFTFGDYMAIPPEAQRKTHQISKLKLPERV
jgi:lipopolysaccharide cholinephosphotransferase